MGKSSKPKTPKPPDPYKVAAAQAQMEQINQTGPFGTISYSGRVGSPDRTQTTTLDPQDQIALDQRRQINLGLLGLAEDLYPQLQAGLDPAAAAERARMAEEATYTRSLNRLRPELDRAYDRETLALEQRGLPLGSEARSGAMDRLDRSRNDALENLSLSAVLAGQQAGLDERRLGLAEREFPLRMLGGLLGNAPIPGAPQYQSPATSADLQGLAAQNYAGQVNNYNAAMQHRAQQGANFWGGLGTLGSAAILGGFNPFGGLGGMFGASAAPAAAAPSFYRLGMGV